MSLTKLQVQAKYPEVYESYSMQAALPDNKYEEKVKFWEVNGINCFERWTIPYFIEREKEKKRPCLRLNYPPDGKCNDCNRGSCRYDKICFMCGLEGHGAFQSYPGGKLKGELKCKKHRDFLSQLGMIRLQHGIDEEGLRVLFKLPPAALGGSGANNTPASRLDNVSGTAGQIASQQAQGNRNLRAVASNTNNNHLKANANGSVKQNNNDAKTGMTAATTSGSMDSAPGNDGNASTGIPNASTGIYNTSSPPQAPIGFSPQQSSLQPHVTPPPALLGTPASALQQQQQNLQHSQHQNAAAAAGGTVGSWDTQQQAAVGGTGAIGGLNLTGGNQSINGLLGNMGGIGGNSGQTNNNNNNLNIASNQSNNSNMYLSTQQQQFGGAALPSLVNGVDSMSLHGSMQSSSNGTVSAVSPAAPMTALAAATAATAQHASQQASQQQQGSFGNIGSLLANMGSGTTQTYDVVESEEYGTTVSLRVASAALVKDESTGTLMCKGSLVTNAGSNDVIVRAWRKHAAIPIDANALRAEIKSLRLLAKRSTNIAKLMHMGTIDLSSGSTSTSTSTPDLLAVISEASDTGTLDTYTASHVQSVSAQGFSTADLQCMCVQLIDTLITCHDMGITHRDIRPAHILVTNCCDKYAPMQFARGKMLKLSNFTPTTLLPLCSAADNNASLNMLRQTEVDKWMAPELDAETRRTGTRYQAASDVWALGLTFYYIATGGNLPYESHQQACEASSNQEFSRTCLEKHGLQERCPMLYDLVERMLRPVFMRAELRTVRCHPFLWSMEMRKSMLINFANATLISGSAAIADFITRIEKISPLYVFGQDGWVASMSPHLLNLVPPKLRTDFWWSGAHLLHAVKNQLQMPDLLVQSVYQRMTVNQALHAYLRQITDVDFPRLLILLFELGGMYGKWAWDGDEVGHKWN